MPSSAGRKAELDCERVEAEIHRLDGVAVADDVEPVSSR
jgi:hypothetical protein